MSADHVVKPCLEGNARNARNACIVYTVSAVSKQIPQVQDRFVASHVMLVPEAAVNCVYIRCTTVPSSALSKIVDGTEASDMLSLVAPSRPLYTSERCSCNSMAGSRTLSPALFSKPVPRACFRRLASRVNPGITARSIRVELLEPFQRPTRREIQQKPLACHSAWLQIPWLCTFNQTRPPADIPRVLEYKQFNLATRAVANASCSYQDGCLEIVYS